MTSHLKAPILLSMLTLPMLLGGCASQLNAVFGRAIVENDLEDGPRTLSMDSSRRSIIIQVEDGQLKKICAEPPPDTADKITAALKANVDAKVKVAEKQDAEGKVSIEDNFSKDAIKLFDRPAAVDVFRTGSFVLCQMHFNGMMSNGQISEAYKTLVEKTFDSLDADYKLKQVEAEARLAAAKSGEKPAQNGNPPTSGPTDKK